VDATPISKFKAGQINLAHEDPTDRFISASAAVYELTLLKADERLLEGRGFKHLSSKL